VALGPKGSVETARKLRRELTGPERKLWSKLRNIQLHGLKFRRQVPLGPYVADFLCFDAKLIVEVDGGQHASAIDADEERSAWLAKNGYRVIRFWNNDVLENVDGVLDEIVEASRQR
jgi:very-short-patch-repair endonuclease